ncbi:MAG: hypothetical protein J6B34_04715 [Clostridia bacterium]|nr:hypothetical protein [Clostridia bacterium]
MKKISIPLLYILSFIVTVLPLAIYLVLNYDKYVTEAPQAIRLSCGGVIIMIIFALKCLGKLKIPSRLTFFAIVLALAYFLEPLICDLVTLSFLALVGEVGDSIIQAIIRALRRKQQNEDVARESAKAIEVALRKTGRV